MKRAMAPAEVATVWLDKDGSTFINGVNVPNLGVHIDVEPDDIATVTVKLPLVLPDGSARVIDGAVRVLYVVSLGRERSMVEGNGATPAAALRDLADRLEPPA